MPIAGKCCKELKYCLLKMNCRLPEGLKALGGFCLVYYISVVLKHQTQAEISYYIRVILN